MTRLRLGDTERQVASRRRVAPRHVVASARVDCMGLTGVCGSARITQINSGKGL